MKAALAVIAGPPLSGKSVVGALAAGTAGTPFMDLDEMVGEMLGGTVGWVFDSLGEEAFREAERRVLAETVGRTACPAILSLGGGTLLDPESLALVAGSTAPVTLRVPPREILRRFALQPSGRPLSGSVQDLAALLERRGAHYRSLPHQVDCTGLTPELCAAAVLESLEGRWKGLEGSRGPVD